MALCFHPCSTALLFLRRPRVLSAAHASTSVQNSEQILRNVVNGSVTVDAMKETLAIIPVRQRRGLLVLGRAAIQNR